VPFLDAALIDVAMRMDAVHKMPGNTADGVRRIEKRVLREAFEGVLPAEILWRPIRRGARWRASTARHPPKSRHRAGAGRRTA